MRKLLPGQAKKPAIRRRRQDRTRQRAEEKKGWDQRARGLEEER